VIYEVVINIFAKCVVLNITSSSGIEVHIEQKYSIAEKRIKTVTLDTTLGSVKIVLFKNFK